MTSPGRISASRFGVIALIGFMFAATALPIYSYDSLWGRDDCKDHYGGPPLSVAFSSNRDGNDEIYVMDPGGAEQTNVTNDPSSDLTQTFHQTAGSSLFRATGSRPITPRAISRSS